MNWIGCAAVETRSDKLSGAPVFKGTRIPISTFFENLKAGATVEEFIEWYPGSRRVQIEEVLSFVAGGESEAA